MKTHHQAIKIILCSLTLGVSVAAQAASSGMVNILGGWFLRGDAVDLLSDAPTNQVFVSAFKMETNLVSYTLWQEVYNYATITNGTYNFSTTATNFGPNHPEQSMSWYDAVKWCNARSQMEGFTPCYYTATNLNINTIYTNGNVVLSTNNVNWAANGYRLPTEAEWEKAARGGLTTNRFPRGMTITHSQACYVSGQVLTDPGDLGPPNVTPTSTVPVGTFQANGYGLYDMAGNVSEWCWDFYSSTYYSTTTTNNPAGPATGSARVVRGGSWNSYATRLRCASRAYYGPAADNNTQGFRCVRVDSQQPQTISFSLNPTYTYGDTIGLTANATASSGGAVTFSNTGPANISGDINLGYTLTVTNVGPVTVIASQAGGLINGTNYAAAYATNYFNVGQKSLTIASGITANNKTYDGTTSATISSNSVVLAGVVSGDSANVKLSTNGYTATFASAAKANGIGVTVNNLTLTGTASSNYTLTQPTGLTANITAVTVTISSGITANNKAYDGTTSATISSNSVVLAGVVSGDSANVKLSTNGYTATFASAAKANGIGVTVNNLTLTGTASSNYTLTQPDLTANITPWPLTITANDTNRIYGATNPTFTVSYSPFANGETTNVLGGSLTVWSPATPSFFPGIYTNIIIPSLLGLTNNNYSVSFVNGTLTINNSDGTTGITNLNGIVDPAALQAFLGNGIVDQAGLNVVLTNYWASSPPYIANFDISAKTNFTFIMTNFNFFTVQFSTNLVNTNWQYLGQVVFQFTDTNAAIRQMGFYRIVASTNSF
jgi:formylglycine-generating enzyme required for sulfatase activity